MELAVEGLRHFLSAVLTRPDTWIVPVSDALLWVAEPMEVSMIKESGVWACPALKYKPCTMDDDSNSTTISVTFREILNVDSILLWQTLFLIVLYLALYGYNRDMLQRKKK